MRVLPIAVISALLSATAVAHDRHHVVHAAGPVPQGHPFLVQQDGVTVIYPVPQRPLQFGLINGRRVLIDPITLNVVRLNP